MRRCPLATTWSWVRGRTYQRAVRTRDYLYVRTLHPGNFKAEWEQLFNVSQDPFLTRELLAEEPALADSMEARLSRWCHEHAGIPGALLKSSPMQATLPQGNFSTPDRTDTSSTYELQGGNTRRRIWSSGWGVSGLDRDLCKSLTNCML